METRPIIELITALKIAYRLGGTYSAGSYGRLETPLGKELREEIEKLENQLLVGKTPGKSDT